MPAGQPTSYSIEIAKEICDKISTNDMGIKQLCRLNPHWPAKSTIHQWLRDHKEFSDLYTQAKQCQVSVIVEEIIDIADDGTNDYRTTDDGREVPDYENIQRSRLRVDTRKWVASKLVPRMYGNVKDSPVKFNFPEDISKDGSVLAMSIEVLKSLGSGGITPDQARDLLAAIKDHGQSIIVDGIEKRINELESSKPNV